MSPDLKKSIGKQLRDGRDLKGWNQDELARRIGTSKTTVCNYETGKQAPLPDVLARLCAVLGIELMIDDFKVRAEDLRVPVRPSDSGGEQLVLDFGSGMESVSVAIKRIGARVVLMASVQRSA